MKYFKRYFDNELQEALSYAGAVEIKGPKFCGKSTTALQVANSVIRLNTNQDIKIVEADTKAALLGEYPRLIDEWQVVPDIWNHIKNNIDIDYEAGKFILTGSATPANKEEIYHSGAGRIFPITMRPMSLYESGDSKGGVSLSDLFDNKFSADVDSKPDLHKIAGLICRGGWPLSVTSDKKSGLKITKGYFRNLFNFSENSDKVFRGKKPNLLYAVLKSYARNVSTEASNKVIMNDVAEHTDQTISPNTLVDYIEALRDLYLVEDMQAWTPHIKSKTTMRAKVTRHFVDPSIASNALGLNSESLLNDGECFGLIFEDLAVRDLRIYAQTLDGTVLHYRDNTGLECDSVILLEDGRWALCEIKLGGPTSIEQGAKTLLRLKRKIETKGDLDSPEFLMILTAGGASYQRKDGIYVVSITNFRA